MLIKNILESLAKDAKLRVKGRTDNRLLRFADKEGFPVVFVVKGHIITGYKTYGRTAKFDLCNPDSLCKILAFMNDD